MYDRVTDIKIELLKSKINRNLLNLKRVKNKDFWMLYNQKT
jgi:hypothetical protein